ncbi:glycosyltransferase [Bacillus sp. T33-2]|uniref:glycosyltransferase n=1 Tax=Bacillus sp. T33-2 TaxID=2054168 RepID=UPI000C78C9C8|nr:glycosyltransferase [Bacillus sp. T33-2]PLR89487.1 hypothetical protein CVD19_23695 [Bacillus sp. T33-2]
MIDEIVRLRRQGLSFQQIAKVLSSTVGKVQNEWAKQSGSNEISQFDKTKPMPAGSAPGLKRLRKNPYVPFSDRIDAQLHSHRKMKVSWRISKFTYQLLSGFFVVPLDELKKSLRLYDVTSLIFNGSNQHSVMEIMIPDAQQSWLLKGLKPNRSYVVEIGVKLGENSFLPIVRSVAVLVPGYGEGTGPVQGDPGICLNNMYTPPAWTEHVSTYSYYETVQATLPVQKTAEPPADAPVSGEPDLGRPASYSRYSTDHEWKVEGEPVARIMMLSWEYPPNIVGGLARHVHGLAVHLVKLGFEIHVITAAPFGAASYGQSDGVHIHRVMPLNAQDQDFLSWIGGLNIQLAQKGLEIAAALKFQLIHAHDWLAGAAAMSLSSALSLPLAVTIHATEHGRHMGIYTEMQRFISGKEEQLARAADQLIVCSEFMKEEAIKHFNIQESKIAVIPNGVEKETGNGHTQTAGEVYPFIHGRKIVFSIGRMVHEKGFETLIEAAGHLKASVDDICFIVAGKGPLLEHYRQLVREKQLDDLVYFIGFISDEIRNILFEKCFLAVFPSLYEPFGIVAVEAMSYGKPVIVSETGGLKGIIQPLTTGLLAKPGDAGDLAAQMSFLLNNVKEGEIIGSKARQLVEKWYGWNRVALETKRIFEETMIISKI